MRPNSARRTTGTVVRRTKATPKPCAADWPRGDELDALLRKRRFDITYSPGDRTPWPGDRTPWCATAWMGATPRMEWGLTPLSAARKLARRLERLERLEKDRKR